MKGVKKRVLVLIFVLVLSLFSFLSFVSAQEKIPKVIPLMSGNKLEISEGTIDITSENEEYYILQLYSRISKYEKETKDKILDLVEFVDEDNYYIFYAKIPQSSFKELRNLINEKQIRYIDSIPIEAKIDRNLFEKIKRNPTKEFNITVSKFMYDEEFSDTQINKIKKLLKKTYSVSREIGSVRGIGDGTAIEKIAKLNFVRSIDEMGYSKLFSNETDSKKLNLNKKLKTYIIIEFILALSLIILIILKIKKWKRNEE